jgi:hypothetical protein
MKRALFALLLAACGAPSMTEELQDAQAAWNVLEMCDVDLIVAPQPEVAEPCANHTPPEGARIDGCSKISQCRIYISDDLDWERRRNVLLHELGHLIKGRPGHLACVDQPGDDIMCPFGAGPWVDAPTARDHAFVENR